MQFDNSKQMAAFVNDFNKFVQYKPVRNIGGQDLDNANLHVEFLNTCSTH